MFFANDQRETVREDNPGITFGTSSSCRIILTSSGQVGKVLGEQWKALSETDRKPYDDKAKVDKERYETEKAAYAVCSSFPRLRY